MCAPLGLCVLCSLFCFSTRPTLRQGQCVSATPPMRGTGLPPPRLPCKYAPALGTPIVECVSETASTPSNPGPEKAATAPQAKVLYTERQWVPWYWWAALAGLALLLAGQFGLNRNVWWFAVPLVLFSALFAWFLFWLSRTTVAVEQDPDGTRWLLVDDANLPNTCLLYTSPSPRD